MPELNAAVPAELILVLVNPDVAPAPPVLVKKPSRLRMFPPGAFKAITRSPTQVWVMFNAACTPVMVALVGIPDTVKLLVAPVMVLSGIATLMVPVVKFATVVTADELVSLTAASPKHMDTAAGAIVGAGGV